MGIANDRNDFNASGLRQLVKSIFLSGSPAYVLIRDGGWQGDISVAQPLPGDGAYLLVRPGFEVLRYENGLENPGKSSVFRAAL